QWHIGAERQKPKTRQSVVLAVGECHAARGVPRGDGSPPRASRSPFGDSESKACLPIGAGPYIYGHMDMNRWPISLCRRPAIRYDGSCSTCWPRIVAGQGRRGEGCGIRAGVERAPWPSVAHTSDLPPGALSLALGVRVTEYPGVGQTATPAQTCLLRRGHGERAKTGNAVVDAGARVGARQFGSPNLATQTRHPCRRVARPM